jgi:hypothetical protein
MHVSRTPQLARLVAMSLCAISAITADRSLPNPQCTHVAMTAGTTLYLLAIPQASILQRASRHSCSQACMTRMAPTAAAAAMAAAAVAMVRSALCFLLP